MAFLRSLVHMLVMGVTLVPFTLAVLLLRVLGASADMRWMVARSWLKLSVVSLRWICGVRWRVQGIEHLSGFGVRDGLVLLPKHQSTYETFLLPAVMPHPLVYVFKKELLSIPFFGWSIGSLDMIHIDRQHSRNAFQTMLEQGQRLLSQGKWIALFPEGTRVHRGEVGSYKTGATRLAIRAGVPVVPVAVTSARCWPRRSFVKHPGVVDVSIGPAIATKGRRHDELMEEVRAWIETEMRRLDPEGYAHTPVDLPPLSVRRATGADAQGMDGA